MQNDDLSQLLSFDTTITSKFNFALFFKKHHSRNDNRIECVRVVPSVSPSLASERAILSGPVSTGKIYGCFEKRYFGPGKVSR